MGKGDKRRPETIIYKCSVCGVVIPVLTRKRNGRPECVDCFKKPSTLMRMLSSTSRSKPA
jgi:hypothetical protein